MSQSAWSTGSLDPWGQGGLFLVLWLEPAEQEIQKSGCKHTDGEFGKSWYRQGVTWLGLSLVPSGWLTPLARLQTLGWELTQLFLPDADPEGLLVFHERAFQGYLKIL